MLTPGTPAFATIAGELGTDTVTLDALDGVVATDAGTVATDGVVVFELLLLLDETAANAGTPKPTTATPAVVQITDFFTGISFGLCEVDAPTPYMR